MMSAALLRRARKHHPWLNDIKFGDTAPGQDTLSPYFIYRKRIPITLDYT